MTTTCPKFLRTKEPTNVPCGLFLTKPSLGTLEVVLHMRRIRWHDSGGPEVRSEHGFGSENQLNGAPKSQGTFDPIVRKAAEQL